MRLTEGQRYTVAILAVVAALLTSSLTRLHGRTPQLISAPLPTLTATTTSPPGAPGPGDGLPPAGPPPVTPRPSALPPVGTAAGGPPAGTAATEAPPATTGTTLGDGSPPPASPCPAEGAVQGVRGVLEQLDDLLGGIVPSATLVTTVALLSGCSQTDPLVLVLAALVELGEGLPDLRLGFLELPVLPFLELPGALIDLLQPLRPAIDPVCETVGTVGLLLSQVGPAYPHPIDKAFVVSLYYLHTSCGQIQRLGA